MMLERLFNREMQTSSNRQSHHSRCARFEELEERALLASFLVNKAADNFSFTGPSGLSGLKTRVA